MLFAMVAAGDLTAEQMRKQLKLVDEELLHMSESNMDFSNALQMNFARDFVICEKGDFALARSFMEGFSARAGSLISRVEER